MITSLTGRVVAVRAQAVVINPGQDAEMGYEIEVFIPAYWADTVASEVGRVLRLYTRLVLESQNQGAAFTPRLLGFPSEADRAFFELFTSVKGLGQRKALKALAEQPAEIAAAIAARDAKALQRLPEIGKRLAETIIAELDGKLGSLPVAAAMSGVASMRGTPGPVGPAADAVAALVALGQTRADAESAVARALRSAPEGEVPSADELVNLAFAAR